jgi:hypothetical protein
MSVAGKRRLREKRARVDTGARRDDHHANGSAFGNVNVFDRRDELLRRHRSHGQRKDEWVVRRDARDETLRARALAQILHRRAVPDAAVVE